MTGDAMTDAQWRQYVDAELRVRKERMDALEQLIHVNAGALDNLTRNTEDLVRAFQSAQGAFRVLEVIGRLVKPLLWLIGAAAAIGAFVAEIRARMGL